MTGSGTSSDQLCCDICDNGCDTVMLCSDTVLRCRSCRYLLMFGEDLTTDQAMERIQQQNFTPMFTAFLQVTNLDPKQLV